MPRRLLLVCCVLLLLAIGSCTDESEPAVPTGAEGADVATEGSSEADADAVRAVLERQEQAWNRGDLVGYMEGYARTDSVRLASAGNVWHGWETTLQRYQATYPDEGTMGTLVFDSVDVRLLSPDDALAFGRWSLERSENYTNLSGLFTVLVERGSDGWRIVHDHSSTKTMLEDDTAGNRLNE